MFGAFYSVLMWFSNGTDKTRVTQIIIAPWHLECFSIEDMEQNPQT